MYVLEARAKLISIAILGKAGVKVSFEYDKIIMTKNNVLIGKGYCNQGLFVLSVDDNNIAFSSNYLIKSFDIWHDRLGNVNKSYMKKL